MFALLAAAGDTGAALMPWGVGVIADRATTDIPWLTKLLGVGLSTDQFGLRAGLLVAAVGPLVIALTLVVLRRIIAARHDSDLVAPVPREGTVPGQG